MVQAVDLDKVRWMLASAARGNRAAQTWLCDPANNPDAAAFFIFNFCFTQDEHRGGLVAPLPDPEGPWGFTLRFVEALDAPRIAPHNLHDEKSRRMLHTWLACHYNLWGLEWVPGYSSLLISKSQDHVDDGGKNSNVFSMFGRMRFAYDRLPDYVRPRPINFSFMSAKCAEGDAFVMGRAPTRDAGRGGGFVRAFVDECAHVEWMEEIHAALDPACKFGKVYMSTVNGPSNCFARIKKERPEGWRFFECDWKEHPELAEGLEPTPEREVERFGPMVSPGFRSITASLSDQKVAQEYGRDYAKARKGLVYRKWSVQGNMGFGEIPLDPDREIGVGIDHAASGFVAFAIGQPVGDEFVNVIDDYEQDGLDSPSHARNLIELLRDLGYDGPLSRVVLIDGPDGQMMEGSGKRKCDYYREAGFTTIRKPIIRGPGSLVRGIDLLDSLFPQRRIRVSTRCKHIPVRIGEYRWPVDAATGQVRDTKPIHDDSEHVMSGLRYLVTAYIGMARYTQPREERIVKPVEPRDQYDTAGWSRGVDAPIMPAVGSRQW
jgi:hypothetical protein